MSEKATKPKKHHSPWTSVELSFIKQHYGYTPDGSMSIREMAEKLGRSDQGICSALKSLGFGKFNDPRPWSESEIEVLRTHYADGDDLFYVQKLLPGRGQLSIKLKASEQGIIRENNWSPDEERILKAFYPVMGRGVYEKLPQKRRRAINNKIKELGLKPRN